MKQAFSLMALAILAVLLIGCEPASQPQTETISAPPTSVGNADAELVGRFDSASREGEAMVRLVLNGDTTAILSVTPPEWGLSEMSLGNWTNTDQTVTVVVFGTKSDPDEIITVEFERKGADLIYNGEEVEVFRIEPGLRMTKVTKQFP
jgi:hypothetical protein